HFYLVAVCGGAVIGYAYAQVQHEPETRWKYAARTLVVDQMGVAAQHRGRGAGTQLLEAVRDLAAAQNVDRLLIHVWAFNPAQRLYERFGFAPFNRKMVVEMK